MNASYVTDKLLIDQYLKSAGVLKCGSFEEKVNVLMDVIDHQSKGYLTWHDLKQLCKQSFTLCVDAETKGLRSTDERQIKPLFEGDKRRYVKYETNPNFNSEEFEEEMSKLAQNYLLFIRQILCGSHF